VEAALVYPVWLRAFAVFTAGVVEETMFRGFAVTRLVELPWSRLLAIASRAAH
jgi:membrane protease YdiL (CAAX protease family)